MTDTIERAARVDAAGRATFAAQIAAGRDYVLAGIALEIERRLVGLATAWHTGGTTEKEARNAE